MPGASEILDDFNRANADSLGDAWSVATDYTLGGTDLGIDSNQADKGTNTGYTVMYYDVETFGPSQECFITVSTKPSDSVALFGRMVNPGASTLDGYDLTISVGSPDTWKLSRVDNGVSTQLGSSASQAIAAGEKMLLQSIGDTHKGYIYTGGAWSEVLSRTDSTYSAPGYVGFYGTGSDSSWRYDDFGGGTVAGRSVVEGDPGTILGGFIVR